MLQIREVPDKYFSYFSLKKICCEYSFKVPLQGTSNMFSGRNKKNISSFILLRKVHYLELCQNPGPSCSKHC